MLEKREGGRRRGQQRMRWLDGITDSTDAHEFEQDPGGAEGQGGLACCDPRGPKELDTTEQLNSKTSRRETGEQLKLQLKSQDHLKAELPLL